jgi:hypothetical protein
VDHIKVFINCCGLFFFLSNFIIILFCTFTRGLTGKAAYSILFSEIKKQECIFLRVIVFPTRSHFIYTALVKLFVTGKNRA